ncbi:MAG: tRNA (uridine(54)-C5)-methyltransferase TrmA [SAR116 cluster bacterium]|nr:tRNA (uridine(54)-C5)-methyltransferase TrmA [SAR116 cluster bacterium]
MLPNDYQPERYQELLDKKVATVLSLFKALDAPEPQIFPSPTHSFRMRAEFRVWHDGEDLNFVMFERERPQKPITISAFPFGSKGIQAVLEPLRARLQGNAALRSKLFQVEFLSTLTGECLVTLIYHRKLDEAWVREALQVEKALNIKVIGRSRGQKLVVSDDWVTETLQVEGLSFTYKQPEQAFIQPNAKINQEMLRWACAHARNSNQDLLELFCGIGNFTIPLSKHYRRVLATEVSKVATRAAHDNLLLNGVNNVAFVRLAAEEVAEALSGAREFRRLKSLEPPLHGYDIGTIFVDPPRAGLTAGTMRLCQKFNQILYISCNPMTLLNNLKTLRETHRIEELAFFDQFPYTYHLECGISLIQRGSHASTD